MGPRRNASLLLAAGMLGLATSEFLPPRHYATRRKPPKPGYGRRRYDKRKYRRQRAGYRTWMKGQR